MAGSIVVAAKRALVGLLAARANLEGVQVEYGWPGDGRVEAERIFTGNSRSDQEPAALRTGRVSRLEAQTFDVLVQVDGKNTTIEDTEARTLELGTEVEECVADNRYLDGAVDGLKWAGVTGWELNTFPTEHGHLSQLIYTIRVQARLT